MTFKCSREVYETARDSADSIRNELKHYPENEALELVYQEADRQCIYTQDNWDVVNLFRCDLESIDVPPMSEYDNIDRYMEAAAWHIWTNLMFEELSKEQDDE